MAGGAVERPGERLCNIKTGGAVGSQVPIREFDLDFEGMKIHCYEGGAGFRILMLHGSGAGTCTTSNWALVMEEMMRHYRVLAADLVGFGLSARKAVAPFFDLDMWTRQAQFLFDRLVGQEKGGFLGHSLSGLLGLRLAASNENLVKLAVTGCPGAPFRLTRALEACWSFPASIQELREIYGYAMVEVSALTDSFFRERLTALDSPGYSAYFSAMFAGDKQQYLDRLVLTEPELAAIRSDVLFVHGLNDELVPFVPATLPLVSSIKSADALLINRCGHGPALEQPVKFMHAVRGLFGPY